MQTDQKIKGAGLIVAASLIFCLMGGLIKSASNIDPYIVTLVRFAIGLAILGSAAMFGIIKLRFVSSRLLLLRGLLGGMATYIFFLSISKLGISRAMVICYSFPIFASVFSAMFLKEKIGALKAAAIIAAFAGICILATNSDSEGLGLSGFSRYKMIAVLGAVLGGAAITVVKKLHDTDSSYAIYFSQCAIGFWLLIVPANAAPNDIGFSGALILLAIGAAGTLGQLLMTQGYKYVPVSTGASIMMTAPVLSYIMGVMIFNEPVSVRSFIGSAIVIVSCIVVVSANGIGRWPENQ